MTHFKPCAEAHLTQTFCFLFFQNEQSSYLD